MNLNAVKTKLFVLVGTLIIVSLLVPCVSAAETVTNEHPYLLFHSITETPGYQNSATDPWKTWQQSVIGSANLEMKLDYSSNLTPAWGTYPPSGHILGQAEGSVTGYNRVFYRGQFAENMALAYQITKDTKYSNKSRDILLNYMNIGSNLSSADFGMALGSYSLAYDWIQPTLTKEEDSKIRDNLATLADYVYKQSAIRSVDYPDFQGHMYPELGVTSAVLNDYTNPNGLALQSTPNDWYNTGTTYLFENDALHPSVGGSMFSTQYDPTGLELVGSYKSYETPDLALWLQVSNNAYGINLLDKYPIVKNAMLAETWSSIPLNDLNNNYCTGGITGWIDMVGVFNLLSDSDKAIALNHYDRVQKDIYGDYSTILPYSAIWSSPIVGNIDSNLLYCVYQGKYPDITRTFPENPSHLDASGTLQVFRNNWSDDSDWMSLVTWDSITHGMRNMDHNDQLGFEYYSRGDLLLADGGEVKHILDRPYGYADIFHNTISIENPRSAFTVQPWDGSTSAGILKGDKLLKLITPATIDSIIQVPWMQLMQAHVAITKVNTQNTGTSTTLSSPIQYERTILYPESDYFIIVDRLEGTEPWIYRNIFRPTSLMVTPTTDAADASTTGHVNGALTIGSTPVDWQGLTYKTETDTGLTTNSLVWNTQNPYGKDVTLNLVTSPSSQVLVEKNVGRIGGYGTKSEVYNPIVWFRSPESTTNYRVTVLLSSYADEQAKTAAEVTVNGNGHALNVNGAGYKDYIYTGRGSSGFGSYSTDAATVYIRESGTSVTDYTILDGSYLNTTSGAIISASQALDYLSVHQVGKTINFEVSGKGSADILLIGVHANSVKMDGAAYSDWSMQDGSILKISTGLSKHNFEVTVGDSLKISPIMQANVTAGTLLTFPVTSIYSGNGVLSYTASNLPKNATFDAANRTFSWVPLNSQAGTYNVTFMVTDGSLSSETTSMITVVIPDAGIAPTFAEIPDQTVNSGTLLTFNVTATDPYGYALSYAASSLPKNATFNSTSGTFSWTPSVTQTGSYNVVFKVTDHHLSSGTTVKITVVSPDAGIAPEFVVIPDQTVNAGNPLAFTVSATDAYGYTLSYTASSLPENATFDATSRTFSWTPSGTQTGSYDITFTANDGTLSSEMTVKITVVSPDVGIAPTFVAIPDQTVNAGNLLTFTVSATDAYGYALSYVASSLPENATFDATSRTFSWTPSNSQVGTFNAIFKVTDHHLSSGTTVKITVNPQVANIPPAFAEIPDQTENAGNPLAFTVSATDAYGYTLSYAASNLPENATFDTTAGTFSWTPSGTQAGSYDITFTVTNGILTSEKIVKITVNPQVVTIAPTFAEISDQTVNAGNPLAFTVSATDAYGYTLSYAASNLPENASFDATAGTFSWTPSGTQAGSYDITFTVTNGILTSEKIVKITVNPQVTNIAPAFTEISDQTVNAGNPLRFTVSATDAYGYTLSYAASNLPENATFDATSGTFSWTPSTSQAGTYNVVFKVTNHHLSSGMTVKITVTNGN